MITDIQNRVNTWACKNFGPDRPAYQRLLGAMEELGELSHTHLKREQNIRLDEDHDSNGKDAVADIIIYLLDYCNCMGWDMSELLNSTWDSVERRDWTNTSVKVDNYAISSDGSR